MHARKTVQGRSEVLFLMMFRRVVSSFRRFLEKLFDIVFHVASPHTFYLLADTWHTIVGMTILDKLCKYAEQY